MNDAVTLIALAESGKLEHRLQLGGACVPHILMLTPRSAQDMILPVQKQNGWVSTAEMLGCDRGELFGVGVNLSEVLLISKESKAVLMFVVANGTRIQGEA